MAPLLTLKLTETGAPKLSTNSTLVVGVSPLLDTANQGRNVFDLLCSHELSPMGLITKYDLQILITIIRPTNVHATHNQGTVDDI